MQTLLIILIIIAALIVVYLAASLGLARLYAGLVIKPARMFCPTEADVRARSTNKKDVTYEVYKNFDWEDFDSWKQERFTVDHDGVEIPVFYFPAETTDRVAIVAHGFGQNHFAMLPQAEIFKRMGYSVLMLDQRCFGDSKARLGSFGYLEAIDVAWLCEWVRENINSSARIVLNGVSMGAVSVIGATQYTNAIDAIIPDCGYADINKAAYFVYKARFLLPNPFVTPVFMRLAHRNGIPVEKTIPIDAIARTGIPVCIIHGDADRAVSVKDAYAMAERFNNPKSRLEIFEGKDHALAIADRERYERVLRDFLAELQ